jgi:hypothetical protein
MEHVIVRPEDHGYWLVRIVLDRRCDPGVGRLGQLLLDELRPCPEGCVHEFAMTGGALLVVARDLQAVWG